MEPQFDKFKEKYQDLIESEEDVLSCALFENVAVNFLKNRKNPQPEQEVVEINLYIGR